ncbi:hypothetical protein AQPE_2901 [Aquipluma nitroreducens]|uniref:Uncharacterized protein n=1 Tax=Aquipluma nitroreducens TaxID=2010828 RepID=A0A5K7SB96_9BACT|nr:hypothetical protein AQPE_2901 [Aquipluma nitroreducens]
MNFSPDFQLRASDFFTLHPSFPTVQQLNFSEEIALLQL